MVTNLINNYWLEPLNKTVGFCLTEPICLQLHQVGLVAKVNFWELLWQEFSQA